MAELHQKNTGINFKTIQQTASHHLKNVSKTDFFAKPQKHKPFITNNLTQCPAFVLPRPTKISKVFI